MEVLSNDWYPMQEWCEHNVGAFNQDWYKLGVDLAEVLDTGMTRTVWYFRRQCDAVAFVLKWL